jgi:hypothetical protein
MAYLNPRFKEHVASLCGTLAGETKLNPMGTCFFAQTVNSTGRTFEYLITAKHVVEGLRKAGGPAFLRINKGRVGEYNKGVIDVQIPIKDSWLYHADPSVDLAVLPYDPSQADKPQKVDTYRFLFLRWESLFAARAKAPMWPPAEAEPVMFVAMTTQFQGERANLPTVRRGHLSLVPMEPIKGAYGPSQYYVIEAQVYPGNSGAPVLVELTDAKTKVSGWYNLGVLVFSYPAEEELKKVKGVEGAYYNLGLSLVVPIEKLEEIVDSKEEKDRREKIKGPHPPGTAISAGDAEDEPFVLTREGFQEALRKG